MNFSFVTHAIGRLLQVLGLVMLLSLGIAIIETSPRSIAEAIASPALLGFVIAIALTFFAGTILILRKPSRLVGNGIREGFTIVTFGWIIFAFFSSIPLQIWFNMTDHSPFSLYKLFYHFTNSYFEVMSGFTTTGSTILTDIEALPKSLLFWRSMTHWLGGMGIVTLVLAIFPASGITGYQMFRGEVPGPTAEKLGPNLRQTAKILWGVYALLTLAETILLMFGGMPLFDSVCHAFGTLATGGFSTKNLSIGYYNSAYIDWVITFFMFLAGMNFLLHYQMIFKRNFSLLTKNSEFLFYSKVLGGAIILSTLILWIKGILPADAVGEIFRGYPIPSDQLQTVVSGESSKFDSFFSALRFSSFQVISITTTTGFMTADYDMWPNALRTMLVFLMFVGGCAGSTAGGIKMLRIQVLIKSMIREVRRMVQPKIVQSIKIGKVPVEEKQVANIVGFLLLFIMTYGILVFAMSFFVEDFSTAATAITATLGNIGPGLAGVGPTQSFNWIPLEGKWICTLAMLLGRLELYTVFIAFAPISWKR